MRLRLGLSALNYHRFTYYFIPFKSCPKCNSECENISHFLFHCPAYAVPRVALLESLSSHLSNDILNNLNILERYLLYGSSELSVSTNLSIFSLVGTYLEATGRFSHGDVWFMPTIMQYNVLLLHWSIHISAHAHSSPLNFTVVILPCYWLSPLHYNLCIYKHYMLFFLFFF